MGSRALRLVGGGRALADGGLPFALPVADAAGCAPFWAEADATVSSLHITSAVVAMAHRVAAHDPAVARHAWLPDATRYCLGEIARLDEPRSALELLYVLGFLDAVAGSGGGRSSRFEYVSLTNPVSDVHGAIRHP